MAASADKTKATDSTAVEPITVPGADVIMAQPSLFAELYSASRKESGFFEYWDNEDKAIIVLRGYDVTIWGARKGVSQQYGNTQWEFAVECLGDVKLWGGMAENASNDALGRAVMDHFDNGGGALTGIKVTSREYSNKWGDFVAYNFVPASAAKLRDKVNATVTDSPADAGDDTEDIPF